MSKTPPQSYKFVQNKACAYFPCHKNADPETFNCLFCYCPLYFLGERCKGNFKKIGLNGEIKDCSHCLIPHKPENYEYIVRTVGEHLHRSFPKYQDEDEEDKEKEE